MTSITYVTCIFHVKIQLFVTAKFYWIRIRIDPHWFDSWIWIRIRIDANVDPHQCFFPIRISLQRFVFLQFFSFVSTEQTAERSKPLQPIIVDAFIKTNPYAQPFVQSHARIGF